MRILLAKICFLMSNYFKVLGKLISPNKTIVADILTLPGWFVLDECIIHQTPYKGLIIGFNWDYYVMPDDWCKEMKIIKGKMKKR